MTYQEARTLEKLTALNQIKKIFSKEYTFTFDYDSYDEERASDVRFVLSQLDKKLKKLKENEKHARKSYKM
jgi:hypothetical protein